MLWVPRYGVGLVSSTGPIFKIHPGVDVAIGRLVGGVGDSGWHGQVVESQADSHILEHI